MKFIATREAALNSLEGFIARAGKQYAATRNYDYGPDHRKNVSGLSPFVSRRMISEAEIIGAVLERHSPSGAQKFIQEVMWRTYWKGWLELRPRVWIDYLLAVQRQKQAFDDDQALAVSYEEAISAQTGIECFDAWVDELVETGYLHNHARMWFASIWIFTLNLPWELGADFFFRHLLDADAASNTLSWRWVAGLHTKGKTYAASASNIYRYTEGRFNPVGQLEKHTAPRQEDHNYQIGLYDFGAIDIENSADDGLLILHEDMTPECSELSNYTFRRIVICSSDTISEECDLSPVVRRFSRAATDDCRQRVEEHYQTGVSVVADIDEIVAWCQREEVKRVIAFRPCQGPWRPYADKLSHELSNIHVEFVQLRRAWDKELHPHARSGYFAFKKSIPTMLKKLDQFC